MVSLKIVTPRQTFYDGDVEMVIFRTTVGDRAIMKNHVPVVAGIVEGKVKIKKDCKFIEGEIGDGFVTVEHNHVTLLTEFAKWK